MPEFTTTYRVRQYHPPCLAQPERQHQHHDPRAPPLPTGASAHLSCPTPERGGPCMHAQVFDQVVVTDETDHIGLFMADL